MHKGVIDIKDDSNDRFADAGQYGKKLTASGCFDRHDIPRSEQINRKSREPRYSTAEIQERKMMNMLMEMKRIGLNLNNDEIAEILNHEGSKL